MCAASYTPIYSSNEAVACPYDGTLYQAKYKGTVCKVCDVCAVGAPSLGLRLAI